MSVFRAIWPITDESVPYDELILAARAEVPALASRAHAHLSGPVRFHLARSVDVPGSGRVTPSVLVAEAPAQEIRRRDYQRLVERENYAEKVNGSTAERRAG